MPIGKISGASGKGADYSSGSTNVDHGKKKEMTTVSGYAKSDSQHSYGAGAVNIEAVTQAPKVGDQNLQYQKSDSAHTYGQGALNIEAATNAPKPKTEGLGAVDKTKEART